MNWEVQIMKSKTSFFNKTVLLKDLTRFTPVWALYTVGALLVTVLISNGSGVDTAINVMESCGGMAVPMLIYAWVCAVMPAGDLYEMKTAGTLHAMPLRREGWYFTHTASGLIIGIVPNILISLLLFVILDNRYMPGETAFIWLGVTVLEFLFFYGTASFCSHCAGSRIGSAAVYGCFNFLSMGVYYLSKLLFEPVLRGISIEPDRFMLFSPASFLSNASFFENTYYYRTMGSFPLDLNESCWLYAVICAVIGIFLWVAGLALYRKRKIESAGDLISFSAVRPVFLVLFSVFCGIFFSALYELFTGNTGYAFFAAGTVVGYFACLMLMKRNVRVFSGRAFIGLAAIAAALTASVLIASADPFGAVKYVPEPSEVAGVAIRENAGYYEIAHAYRYTSDPEAIEAAIRAHRDILDTDAPESGHVVMIAYNMKGGGRLIRNYDVGFEADVPESLLSAMSAPEIMLATDDFDVLLDELVSAVIGRQIYYDENDISLIYDPSQEGPALIADDLFAISEDDFSSFIGAFLCDCDTGASNQLNFLSHKPFTYLELYWKDRTTGDEHGTTVTIWEDTAAARWLAEYMGISLPEYPPEK